MDVVNLSSPLRTLDVTDCTLTEMLEVLGTLITDLDDGVYDGGNYLMLGVTPLRQYDADDSSITQLSRVLGTLIEENPYTSFDAQGFVAVNIALIDSIDVTDASLFEFADALGVLLSEYYADINGSEVMVEMVTFQDAVDHMMDVYRQDRSTENYRNARRAVHEAYRDIPRQYDWNYFVRRGMLMTVAYYSTGTIAYTEATRTATLTGGTWPSWAKYGILLINQTRYPIEQRVDATNVTLVSGQTPGADVAAGTAYQVWRSVYVLPDNFARFESDPIDLPISWQLEPMSADQLLALQAGRYSPQQPLAYTVRASGDYPGQMEVELAPPPVQARTYDYTYAVDPRPFGLKSEYTTGGTVSVSAGTSAVTGVGTAFTSQHVGCIMRFSSGATQPTGLFGDATSDTPYAEQAYIVSVTDATSLTLDTNAAATYSGVNYTISDPVDLEPGAMLTYFLRLAEARYERLMQTETQVEAMAEAQRMLKAAIASDYRHVHMRGTRVYGSNRLGAMAIPEAYGGSVIT